MSLGEELYSKVDQVYVELSHCLDSIKSRLRWKNPTIDFAPVFELIASLPLTTDEFGRFHNCLRNAQRYVESDEIGAARHELRQITAWVYGRLPRNSEYAWPLDRATPTHEPF